MDEAGSVRDADTPAATERRGAHRAPHPRGPRRRARRPAARGRPVVNVLSGEIYPADVAPWPAATSRPWGRRAPTAGASGTT